MMAGLLTTEQMIRIMNDEMLNQPQREKGEAAEKFLKEFKKDRAEIEAQGLQVHIPNE